MNKNVDSYLEEKNNLTNNQQKIDNCIENFQENFQKNNGEINDIPSNDYELLGYKQELLSENKTLNEKIKFYQEKKLNPYFGHMLLNSNHENFDMYIGENSIVDLKQDHIVYDWRSPVASLFYENQLEYQYQGYLYNVELKRKLEIQNGELIDCFDNVSKGKKNERPIADEFLLKVLNEKRNIDEFVDIIRTIQGKQNEIIRNDKDENMIVQGIAGSGKTVIILHRLSYLLFNYPDIHPTEVLFLAPTNIFKNKLNALNQKLQIDKIPILTLSDYYLSNLKILFKDGEQIDKIENDTYSDSSYFRNKYKDSYYIPIIEKFRSIFENSINKYQEKIRLDYDAIQEKEPKLINQYKSIKLIYNEKRKPELKKLQQYSKELDNLIKEALTFFYNHIEEKTNSSDEFFSIDDFSTKNFTMILEKTKNKILRYIQEAETKNSVAKGLVDEKHILEIEVQTIIDTINTELKKQEINISFDSLDTLNFHKMLEQKINITKKELTSITKELQTLTEEIGKIRFIFFQRKLYQERINNQENLILKLEKTKKQYELLLELKNKYQQNILEKMNRVSILQDEINSKYLSFAHLQTLENYYNDFTLFIQKIRKYNGYIKITQESMKNMIRILNIFYNRCGNPVIVENFDFNTIFEKIEKDIDWTLLIHSSTIISDIDTKLNSKYLWDLYQKYLEENDVLAKENYYIQRGKKINRADAYILLRLATELGYISNDHHYRYIYIDEAQDYNDNEVKLIKNLEGSPILNIYGDLGQKIFPNVGFRKNWNELSTVLNTKFKIFELKENYRNTTNVVEYCNQNLKTNMLPIGNAGQDVKVMNFTSLNEIIKNFKNENYIVITNRLDYLKRLKYKNIKCCTVYEAKGLEFPNVIVIEEPDWNNCMKYVAYTRSLNQLIIFQIEN